MRKTKIALVRGMFLNKYEMQSYEHLSKRFEITAFGSRKSFHRKFTFPVVQLVSPVDLPNFPFKMPILNRIFTDAHCLINLDEALNDYDIAHSAETYFHYTQQCLDAKKKGEVKKVVVTVLENIPFANEKIMGRKRFKKRAYKEVDKFLATTEDAKKALLLEGVDEKRIEVIGSGVDVMRFRPVKKKKSNVIHLLFVGRLESEKGIHNVIDAFINVRQSSKKLHLTVVGTGNEFKNLNEKLKNHKTTKSVTFKIVPYEKIHREYQNADIFLAPSIDTDTWREQYGYSIVEAMASGIPVITTDAGSIPEVVGKAAIIVSQNDTLGIEKSIKHLLSSEKKRKILGKKARTHVVKFHNSRKIAKKIEQVYKSIL